jgi:hypothetical protein
MKRKNLRKIPDGIRAKVQSFSSDEIVAGAAVRISVSELMAGDYAHLELTHDGTKVLFEPRVMPKPSAGRYSRANIDGKVIVRRDLPKVKKDFDVETPNFGDWSKGSHTVTFTRDVYPREFQPPKDLSFEIHFMGEVVDKPDLMVFLFVVEEVLDRTSEDFESSLLFDLNLLQENLRTHDVNPASSSRQQFLDTLFVDWEILPLGDLEESVDRILTGVRGAADIRPSLQERFEVLMSLNPMSTVVGKSGLARYFGAKFADDLVAFDNLEYGNAIYVLGENWEELSQLTRIDLRSEIRSGFIARIEHRVGWDERLRSIISREKRARGL